jgi:hypothetical protein
LPHAAYYSFELNRREGAAMGIQSQQRLGSARSSMLEVGEYGGRFVRCVDGRIDRGDWRSRLIHDAA